MSPVSFDGGVPGMVTRKARRFIRESWQTEANLSVFLVLLVILIFVFPSVGFGTRNLVLYGDVVFLVLLISGIIIAWRQRWLVWLAVLIGAPALVLRFVSWRLLTLNVALWRDGLGLAAILLLAGILLKQVFRPGPVNSMRLQGAVAAYLLFGLAWASAYQICALLVPDSFNVQAHGMSEVREWIYFSFMTLTTVGYGDVLPLHRVARTLAVAEALMGQLYLAVLVARLVALQVVSWQSEKEEKQDE